MTNHLVFDVVIVGSGPGGGSVAYALAALGAKVAILEAGPNYDPLSDYGLDRADWEQNSFPLTGREEQSYSVAPLQKLEKRWVKLRSWNNVSGFINTSDQRMKGRYSHVQGVGGATLHYQGEAHRLNPLSMRLKSRFGVGADWPFNYSELEPYYVAAEHVIGVAGPIDEPVRWRSEPYPLPPHAVSYASRKMEAGCKKLGISFTANSLGILSRIFDDRPACNYCANCVRGCPRLDKGSVDVTFITKALATKNCTLMPNSQVIRLDQNDNDRISTATFIDSTGQEQTIAGRTFVVACGAVHTPRLLLASANRHAPDGVANESGEVGRNFMETLALTTTALHPESLASYRGVPADSICWDFNAPDAIPDVIGGCRFSFGAPQADLVGPISYSRRIVGGWGREHKANMRKEFGHALTVVAIGENLPNPKSFVDLDPEKKDHAGVPVARIHSFLPEMEIMRMKFMASLSRDILKAAGAVEPVEQYGSYDFFDTTHVFGTCRMGDDPRTSVVNAECRSHRWHNLYICDASVFPTSGGGEAPSLTIEALGMRCANSIQRNM